MTEEWETQAQDQTPRDVGFRSVRKNKGEHTETGDGIMLDREAKTGSGCEKHKQRRAPTGRHEPELTVKLEQAQKWGHKS